MKKYCKYCYTQTNWSAPAFTLLLDEYWNCNRCDHNVEKIKDKEYIN